MELLELAKKEYADLMKKKAELQKEIECLDKKIKPISLFLNASGEKGATEGKKRGRKSKAVIEVK